MPPRAELLDAVARIARQAGHLIMGVYATDFQARRKDDASPVTEADELAEACILEGLRHVDPGAEVVSEEAAARAGLVQPGRRFWLVDPLDGTKEFISRNGEFTVNIALVEDGDPVLGVVYAPAVGRLFAGARGLGAYDEHDRPTPDGQAEADATRREASTRATRRPIACRRPPPEGLDVLASRSHGDAAALDAYLAPLRVRSMRSAGSSLKLCLLAAGEADLYPRLGRTMEWDIAAGHAVLLAAGGHVHTLAGGPLRYGKPGLDNPDFVARGLDSPSTPQG